MLIGDTVTSSDFPQDILVVVSDDAGGSAAFTDNYPLMLLIAYLNSYVASYCLKTINPTLNFQAGNISNLPIKIMNSDTVTTYTSKLIDLSKTDWDLLKFHGTLLKTPLFAMGSQT